MPTVKGYPSLVANIGHNAMCCPIGHSGVHYCMCCQGFIQDFPFGGGISIYEKEGCVMRKRGVGDKSLCQ